MCDYWWWFGWDGFGFVVGVGRCVGYFVGEVWRFFV